MIADIGHFESEQFTKEIFYEILTKKISKFAVQFSEINTNPIKYLLYMVTNNNEKMQELTVEEKLQNLYE